MSGISEGAATGRKFQEAKIPGAVKRADSAEWKNNQTERRFPVKNAGKRPMNGKVVK
jgi:hypothetical protein